jgi:hypothetical protein
MTVFNQRWVWKQFSGLKERINSSIGINAPYLETSVDAAGYLLEEGQQAPLRCLDGELVVSTQHEEWWKKAKVELQKAKRSVTFSLVAQLLFATLAFIFTLAEAFPNSGSLPTPTQMSASGIWAWMVPVCAGWVFVGTQNKAGTIEKALKNDRNRDHGVNGRETVQNGIQASGGFNFSAENNPPGHSSPPQEPRPWGISVAGDEGTEGPIFNYARFMTWWRTADTIHHSFVKTLNIHEGLNRDSENSNTNSTTSNCQRLSMAYPEFKDIDPHVWGRVLCASAMALFVQWGTTGPSIVIAYLTPTVGLGCRSGSYLLYGCLATLSWFTLLGSVFLSHAAMLRVQAHAQKPNSKRSPRLGHKILYGLAITSRIPGKFIAVTNAIWLLASSFMEYLGVFENCWCNSSSLSLGDVGGWVTLFPTAQEIQQLAVAKGYLSGGIAFSVLVFTIATGVFALARRKSD